VLALYEAGVSVPEGLDAPDPWGEGYAAEPEEKWPAVVVMAMRRVGGVVERLALGKVVRGALERGVVGDKMWREVLLG
jgi:hypothetical protein